MKVCPKCGHRRTEKDEVKYPKEECPQCHVIYSKYKPKAQPQNEIQDTSGPAAQKSNIGEKTNNIHLTNCKDCGKEVSKKAETCPHCGAPIKKPPTQYGCGTLILIVVVVSILIGIFSSNDKSTPSAPRTPEEVRKEKIEKNFSAWDGSHRQLTEIIKKSMNDPASYEHEETVYWDNGDHLIVKTTFRGKNVFGGVVKNWVKAKVDLSGNVLAVIEQGQ